MADIITLSEYKVYDDAPSPAENDNQINAAIDLATSYIEEKSGRTFEIADNPSPNDSVETLDGNGTSRLYTHDAPVTAVSKIEYWNGSVWTEFDAVSQPYTFKTGSNIVRFTGGHTFFKGYQNIRVTFEHGFTDSFPDNLKLACYQIAKHIVNEAERQGVANQNDGEQTFTYSHTVPKMATEIIARYKTVW